MTKVAFIVPLKERGTSADWDLTCKSVNATLRSLSSQTDDDFRIILVCNDLPVFHREYAALECLETDIRIEGAFSTEKGRLNKQRKVLRALLHLKDEPPEMVMSVDADDLIHRDLIRHVKRTPNSDGFIVNRGYRYRIGKSGLRKCLNYHLVSGSSLIFPYRRDDFDAISSSDEVDAHHFSRQAHPRPGEAIFRELGKSFTYIPFFAGIYLQGHEHSLRDQSRIEAQAVPSTPHEGAKSRRRLLRRANDLGWKVIGRLRGNQPINSHLLEAFPGLSDWQ